MAGLDLDSKILQDLMSRDMVFYAAALKIAKESKGAISVPEAQAQLVLLPGARNSGDALFPDEEA